MAVNLDGLRQKVFLDRYALKDKDGSLIEHTPEEMWARVSKGIAQNEKKRDRAKREKEFYEVMSDFKFVPGGRILSGAGTDYQVTYFNCFVIPSPKDSREGILESLKQLVEIQSRAGGVGLNLSSLRPRGARVKKVNGTSSGPVTWAGLFSYATHDVVQQGGSRRGATMLMLWDWHPDVEEFITVKQDLTKINGANLSVCVSDAFMEAVKQDADWDLMYPDINDPEYDEKWNGEIDQWKALGKEVKVYKTVKARYLWDLICTAAWQSAEPGLHFMERSNKRSNTWYFERLVATNPCLTADTWIHTNNGPRQICDLVGKQFTARIDGADVVSGIQGFFKTATKQVINLQTKEGYLLKLTADHKVRKISKLTRYALETAWVEAGSLQSGDKVLLNNQRSNIQWQGKYSYEDGYLIGLLIGDGTLKSDKAVLSVWDNQSVEIVQQGSHNVMQTALQMVSALPHRKDFGGWTAIPERNEYRLSTAYIKRLAHTLGMSPGNKVITPEIEKASSDFYKGFLKGFFDADGSVQGNHEKGVSVRLSQSDLSCLESVQRMLLRLGIVSRLYKNRRIAGEKMLPDGKGDSKIYSVKAQHDLVISGENLVHFSNVIGFADAQKAARLEVLLTTYKRKFNRERFIANVASISSGGIEDVYDVQIPSVHEFDANGFHAHNCGEQPLGPWAVCNLGAMNLSVYVKDADLPNDKPGWFDYDSFAKDVKVAMRILDNVIDQTYYFFKENEEVAKDIRRTGLGIMGLGDALIKMHIKYGSDESIPVLEKIFKTLRDNAYDASADLAEEKGAFPKFDEEKYLQGYHIKALPKAIREKIKENGIRNAVLLTIAPTGTTSLVSGVSSGVEPVYEFSFLRRWRGGEEMVYHPLFDEWRKAHPEQDKPEYFCSANDLTPLEHVRVQAIAQEYIDSSISKTVNAPNSHTVDDVKNLYMSAYDYGLKGVTYMRDGSRQGVLERVEEKKKEEPKAEIAEQHQPALPMMKVIPRPSRLDGTTYQTDSPVGKTYITINHTEDNEPFEVFITVGRGGSDVGAMAEALGRMISLNLRVNGNITPREKLKQIVAQLTGIGGARSIGFGINRVRSHPDAVAKVLSQHFGFSVNGVVQDKKETLALLDKAEAEHEDASQQLTLSEDLAPKTNLYDICPECGVSSFAYEDGCKKCYSCGHSEC